MSKIGDFFKNFFSGANGLSSLWNGLTDSGNTNIANIVAGASGSRLTDAQKESNLFAHDEAALQRHWASGQAERDRTFQAKQAEISRDWNEEMYEKYNSLSGKIAQAEQAGVNPLFAVTGNAVTPMSASSSSPSGASVSGASASSAVSPTGHSLTDLLGSLMGFMKLKSDIDLNESQVQKNVAEANNTDKETSWIDRLNNMSLKESEQNISESVYRILNISADTEVKTAELGEIAAGIANTNADTKVKQQQIAVLLSEISLNSKSVEQMEANISLMLSEIGVNRAEATKLAQEVRNLRQEYTSGRMLAEARKMATPDGTESAFDKLCFKLVGLLKK